jgi:hypothetical protein
VTDLGASVAPRPAPATVLPPAAAEAGRLRRFSALALLAVAVPLAGWMVGAAVGQPGLYNDFHSYWYAGRLLAAGGSPYDLAALRDLAARSGDTFMVGTGFSYPLPFAFVMLPLAALPFGSAIVIFNAISLAAFGAAVALWLVHVHPLASPRSLGIAALLAGAFPPVTGSVLNGQVNLLVVGALAMGALAVLRPATRAWLGATTIGLAAIVKLVPGAVVLPLWLAGRRSAVGGILAGAGIPLLLASILRPRAALESDALAALFAPDPFVTNQSVNGFVGRLVLSTDRMTALAPAAFDPLPVAVVMTVALAGLTIGLIWRCRGRLADRPGLAVAFALVLVGATAGAPKTSFWNEVLVLPAVGLLLAVAAPRLTWAELAPVERRLLAAWWLSCLTQPIVWLSLPRQPGPENAVIVLLGSLALYGSLALWWLLARRLLRPAQSAVAQPRVVTAGPVRS